MAATERTEKRHEIGVATSLAGILAILIDEREQRLDGVKDVTKTEVLLARAGLTNEDISAVTGKKADTVRVTLRRAEGR